MTTLRQYRDIVSVVGVALIAVWILRSEAELDGAACVAGAVAASILWMSFVLPRLRPRRSPRAPHQKGTADDV